LAREECHAGSTWNKRNKNKKKVPIRRKKNEKREL